jgi:hypothetical protein
MAKFVRGVVVSRFGGGEYVVEKVGERGYLFFSRRFFIFFSDLAEKWGVRDPTRGR